MISDILESARSHIQQLRLEVELEVTLYVYINSELIFSYLYNFGLKGGFQLTEEELGG